MDKSIPKRAFAASVPVLSGYVVLGTGFGILLQSRGYGLGWALAMSIFIYAGSMQYLAVELLSGGAGLLTAAVTALAQAIAADRTNDELNILGVILTQLGDTILTIAAHREICGEKGK